MLRTLFIVSVLSSFLFSATNYTVRLAVFKNTKQLQKNIDKYPSALKNTVKTYRKRGFTYAYTVPTKDKKTLKKLLPAYRKVFSDAYIQPTRLK
jgi:hypothetical protein